MGFEPACDRAIWAAAYSNDPRLSDEDSRVERRSVSATDAATVIDPVDGASQIGPHDALRFGEPGSWGSQVRPRRISGPSQVDCLNAARYHHGWPRCGQDDPTRRARRNGLHNRRRVCQGDHCREARQRCESSARPTRFRSRDPASRHRKVPGVSRKRPAGCSSIEGSSTRSACFRRSHRYLPTSWKPCSPLTRFILQCSSCRPGRPFM